MMKYAESERKLIDSIHASHGNLDSEIKIELFTLTRSIDWPILFSNPERMIRDMAGSITSDVASLLNSITAGVVARDPAFRPNTTANMELIYNILDSFTWWSSSKLVIHTSGDRHLEFDRDLIESILSDSPDLVVLYMLSQLKLEIGNE